MKVKSDSFLLRMLFQNIIGIVFISIVFFIISYSLIKNSYISSLRRQLISNINLVMELTSSDINKKDLNSVDSRINKLENVLKNTRFTIIKSDGSVIGDSKEDISKMVNHLNREEVIEAFEGETGEALRYSETLKNDMLYIALPFFENGEITHVYRASVLLSDIKKVAADFRLKMSILSVIIIIAAGIYLYFVAANFSEPVELLSEASKKVADGDFNILLFFKNTNYEIKNLIKNFNEMTEKLKKYFNELINEKEELGSIISSMEEGILVADNFGKIIKTNQGFLKIVNRNDILGKYYWEILRDSDITDFIKNKGNNKNSCVKEIDYFEKILLCSMNSLSTDKGFVFVFYDITNIKNLEKVKKDFTSNVSHELRTPLTAIKGFTETLLDDESKPDKKKYLDIILRNTDRLINIVNDLLTLSKIEEEKAESLFIEEIEFEKVFKNIFSIFEKKVAEKELTLTFKNQSSTNKLKTDLSKFEQIFINLIDNALKYTDKGKVLINVFSDEDEVVIDVVDSGIGIPEKDIQRIFERFYVVDKSRSKNTGGTGLGLAIVKHDVGMLSAEISVQSIFGKGSTFKVIFSKNINS